MIGMLLDGEYPKDIRVRKEAESLVENGFEVVVICPKKPGMNEKELHNGVLIYRIGNNYTFNKKGIYDILGAINFVNPFFKRGLAKAIKEYKIKNIHVHDLPLAKTALRFKKNISGKIILDLHENYPEGLKVWASWKKNPIIRLKNRIFFGYRRWFNYEKKMVASADIIIAVVKEMKDRLISFHNVEPEKIRIVTNSEKIEFSNNKSETSISAKFENFFLISYIGGIGPHRGLDTAIRGISTIKDRIPNLKMIIVGGGSSAVLSHLKTIVIELELENYVEFLGFHPFSEVWGLMKNSDINIIPHKSNSHTNNTIPHKLFQAMMSNSPLLVSSCKPLKRIVSEFDAGYVFTADSAASFGEVVEEIFLNPKEAMIRSNNAVVAIKEKGLNWEKESVVLNEIYKKIP